MYLCRTPDNVGRLYKTSYPSLKTFEIYIVIYLKTKIQVPDNTGSLSSFKNRWYSTRYVKKKFYQLKTNLYFSRKTRNFFPHKSVPFLMYQVQIKIYISTSNKEVQYILSITSLYASDFPTDLYLGPRSLIIGKISSKWCELGKVGKTNKFISLDVQ